MPTIFSHIISIDKCCKRRKALELTYNDIADVPVADASSVSDWNTFFALPTNGTPFTSVVVDGNVVKLYGGGSITLRYGYFYDDRIGGPNRNIKFYDYAGCIIALDEGAFGHLNVAGCLISEVYLPNCLAVGFAAFAYARLTILNIPKCSSLGGSVLADEVFYDFTGGTVTLTVPASLMTCNGGNPDGDIQYLQANNTVTIVEV